MPSAAHVDRLAGLIVLRLLCMAGLVGKCIVLDLLSAALQIEYAEHFVDRVVIHRVADREDRRLDLVRNDLIISGRIEITEVCDAECLAGGCIFLFLSCHTCIDDIAGIHIDDRIFLEIRILEDSELLRVFLISETARRDDIELLMVAVISVDQKNCDIVEMKGVRNFWICALPVSAVEGEARSLVRLLRHGEFCLVMLLLRTYNDGVHRICVIISAVDLRAPDDRSFDIAACVK